MTFWSGPMDPAPDPAIFVIDLQDANKKLFFSKFFCLLLFEGTFSLFLKSHKKVTKQNSSNQGISYYFCLMIEGSGSVHLTNGSGSRWPKNIRIRNTDGSIFVWRCAWRMPRRRAAWWSWVSSGKSSSSPGVGRQPIRYTIFLPQMHDIFAVNVVNPEK